MSNVNENAVQLQKGNKHLLSSNWRYKIHLTLHISLSVKSEKLNSAKERAKNFRNQLFRNCKNSYVHFAIVYGQSNRQRWRVGRQRGARARWKTKNVSERQTKMYLWDTWPDRQRSRSLSFGSLALITYEFAGFVFLLFYRSFAELYLTFALSHSNFCCCISLALQSIFCLLPLSVQFSYIRSLNHRIGMFTPSFSPVPLRFVLPAAAAVLFKICNLFCCCLFILFSFYFSFFFLLHFASTDRIPLHTQLQHAPFLSGSRALRNRNLYGFFFSSFAGASWMSELLISHLRFMPS